MKNLSFLFCNCSLLKFTRFWLLGTPSTILHWVFQLQTAALLSKGRRESVSFGFHRNSFMDKCWMYLWAKMSKLSILLFSYVVSTSPIFDTYINTFSFTCLIYNIDFCLLFPNNQGLDLLFKSTLNVFRILLFVTNTSYAL